MIFYVFHWPEHNTKSHFFDVFFLLIRSKCAWPMIAHSLWPAAFLPVLQPDLATQSQILSQNTKPKAEPSFHTCYEIVRCNIVILRTISGKKTERVKQNYPGKRKQPTLNYNMHKNQFPRLDTFYHLFGEVILLLNKKEIKMWSRRNHVGMFDFMIVQSWRGYFFASFSPYISQKNALLLWRYNRAFLFEVIKKVRWVELT
jgi:hypothetical protein